MNAELLPIAGLDSADPPELADEGTLLLAMAVKPMDPEEARAFVRKKYLHYFLTFLMLFGSPLLLFWIMARGEHGWSRLTVQIAVVVFLALFFILFIVMIVMVASRGKVAKYLGFRAIEGREGDAASDVSMVAERRGRVLEYGVSQDGNFWRYRGSFPVFRVENRGGTFFADAATPAYVRTVLGRLPPHRRWRKLALQGGPEGLRSSRPVRLAKLYLFDLWLLERILAQKNP